jgi:hypothetical protein
MSEGAGFDTSDSWQKLVMKWNAAGHEVIHDRSTLRLVQYRKEFDPSTPVMRDGKQFVTSSGHRLVVGDLFPERADLCLDANANMISQRMFEDRYITYLKWFDYVEGSDPEDEPIPNIKNYIAQTNDRFSDSRGMVEIGFDADKPAEKEMTHMYDPGRDELVEVTKKQGEALETTLEAVKKLLEMPPKRGPGRPPREAA